MGKISLVFILIVAGATFYFTSQSYQGAKDSPRERTWIDKTGHLHVMGIVLGESTVRDAELAFRSRVDSAIFMYPLPDKDGKKQFSLDLEAYFPAIADHSKIILRLDIDDTRLEAMRKRSTSPRIYPNGVARRNLATEDILTVRTLTILEYTLIPSIELNKKMVLAQFGQPTSESSVEGVSQTYTYPKIGLVATIYNDAKDKLVFNNPTTSK